MNKLQVAAEGKYSKTTFRPEKIKFEGILVSF